MSQFELRPVAASPTLGQRAYDAIAGLIDTGQVKPGQRLVESDLATALGVSRGPVREALHLLSKEGWVDIRPRLGAFVHEATPDEVDPYFDVRKVLEVESARLAALNRTEQQLAELKYLHGDEYRDRSLDSDQGLRDQSVSAHLL